MAARSPVVIVGGARSGTTFLAKLLDSHPDVLYRHEPDSVLINTRIPFLPRREEIDGLLEEAGTYLDSLRDVRARRVSGKRPIFDKSYRSALRKACFLSGLSLARLAELAGRFAGYRHIDAPDCVDRRARERIVYLIKSVDSPWRTMLYNMARPDWRFIHILRHPCAVINSKLRGIESNLMTAGTYLHSIFDTWETDDYPLTLQEMETRSFEEQLAFQWMVCNQCVVDEMSGRDRYRLVIYEELCRDLAEKTRSLFAFAGLSFDEQTERFLARLDAMEGRDSRYFDVMRPPKASLYKWREQLSAEQIENIRKIVCHSEIGRRFFGIS